MRNIILIGFILALCPNLFSQAYKDLKTQDEKLDYIYDNILSKQISDYLELNEKYGELKISYEALQSDSSTKVSKITDLNTQNNKLASVNLELEKANGLKDNEILGLKSEKEIFLKLEKSEKNRVKKEILFIIKYEGIISEDLLKSTKERASAYGVSKTIDLGIYIEVNKNIIGAQSLLAKNYDKEKVQAKLTVLKNIKNNKFIWQQRKVSSLIVLLEAYCENAMELKELFDWVDGFSGGAAEAAISAQQEDYKKFTSYPFLVEEINEKKKNPDYKSKIKKCGY